MLTTSRHERRCPRCGTRVAQQAHTCLLCGYRLDRGSYLGAVLVLVVVAVVAGAAIAALRDRSSRAQSKRTVVAVATEQRTAATVTSARASLPPTTTRAPSPTKPATPLPTPTNTNLPTAEPTATPLPSATATEMPAPTPAEAPTAAPTSGPIIHSVESGDSLLYIANKYGTTVDAILAANPNLTKYTILSIGQQITVPTGGSAATSTPAAGDTPVPTPAPQFIIHIVEAGDTLGYLASKYDSTVADIVSANEGLTERTMLSIGQEVKVPIAAPTGEPPSPTPTVEATAQAMVTTPAEATPGTAATVLAGPIATPTGSLFAIGGPAQPRALELLSPIGGARVPLKELMLNWTGVGELAPDLWYVVNIWPVAEYQNKVLGWTKANSWRPGADLLSRWGTSPHLLWSVGLERELATDADGTPLFEPAGPRTEPQDFYLLPE